jgi:hypothetical protein
VLRTASAAMTIIIAALICSTLGNAELLSDGPGPPRPTPHPIDSPPYGQPPPPQALQASHYPYMHDVAPTPADYQRRLTADLGGNTAATAAAIACRAAYRATIAAGGARWLNRVESASTTAAAVSGAIPSRPSLASLCNIVSSVWV